MISPIPEGFSLPLPENGSRLGEAQGTIGYGGKRLWIYPKEITGKFTRSRHKVAWLLMLIYLGVPWIHWHGQPLILLDWSDQRLTLLGNYFWAKDIPLFLPLFFSFILLVFLATAKYGRLWCGWACPQTIFLQFVFLPVEKLFEGRASRRKARDKNPWSRDWIWRKILKHFCFALIAWWIGNTALAYSWGVDNLLTAMMHPSHENWVGLMLVVIFAVVFYLNFAFFKEQACILVCPYARFQSLLPDENTSLIAYDAKRGEPNGKGQNGSRVGFGDCTNCKQCVLVCPTGIDIRDGQQLECIGCARCIDACDITMKAWKKPTGLVRYASLRELQDKSPNGKPLRLFAYAILSVVMASISITFIVRRPVITVDAMRRGNTPYVRLGQDSVLNNFNLYLRNNSSSQKILHIQWEKSNAVESVGQSSWDGKVFVLSGGQSTTLPLEITAAITNFQRGKKTVSMELINPQTKVPFKLELAGPWGK